MSSFENFAKLDINLYLYFIENHNVLKFGLRNFFEE